MKKKKQIEKILLSGCLKQTRFHALASTSLFPLASKASSQMSLEK